MAAKGVVVEAGRNLGDLFEQFLEKGAGEKVVGLGKDAGKFYVVLLDVAHCFVEGFAHVGAFGQREKAIKPGVGREIEDALSLIGGGIVEARPTARGCGCFLQLRSLRGKADFGEAQEDETEDGLGILRGGEARVGAKLVSSGPEAFL